MSNDPNAPNQTPPAPTDSSSVGAESMPLPTDQPQSLWLRLPCVHCGAEIPELIEGTTIKCFVCNTENTFMESKALLENTCVDVFGKTLSIEFIEDPSLRAQARIMRENRLGELFSNLESEHMNTLGKIPVISTPLEKYPIPAETVLGLAKQYNTLAILLKNYVLPLALVAEESVAGNQMYYFCVARALMLVASYQSIQAALANKNETAWNIYTVSGRNFQKMAEFSNQALANGLEDDRFKTFKVLGEAYSNYAIGLSFISKGNPEWASREFSRVRSLLTEVVNAGTDPRAKIDHAQAGMIVALQPSIETIFKELKEGAPLRDTLAVRSLPIDSSQQIIETLEKSRQGLEKGRERFFGIVDFFRKLNFGEELEYVKRYIKNYEELTKENQIKFDQILDSTVKNLINDYKFRCREVYRRMELIAQAAKLPGETTKDEIKEQRNELDMLERNLEPTLSKILSLAYGEIKKEGYIKEIKPFLDESHQIFDKWVRDAILHLISDYSASANDITGALNAMIANAKLDSGIAQQFADARKDMDSLGFAISEIVDLSYAVRRADFTDNITVAQTQQRRHFDRLIQQAIYQLIRDYNAKNTSIVMGMEPVINSAKILGNAAVEEIVQGKNDINALDALFDQTIGTILNASYNVKRGQFTEAISEVQAVRKRDFTDEVRKATTTLLDFAGRGRKDLQDDRIKVVAAAEKAMMSSDYKHAGDFYEMVARMSSELGEAEKATEYAERAKSMQRLVF